MTVFAQEQDQDDGDSVLLEEVIVTAQRREQSIQDVAISMTALSERDIKDMKITDVKDLEYNIPGLIVTGQAEGQIPSFRIRSLSFGGIIGAQAASVNVDEVAFSYGLLAAGQQYDIQRVEVLKGPQGDLYGRNTTGGAINFITNKPHAGNETRFQAGIGNFQSWETEGVINRALSPTVNARFSWRTDERGEGWMKNWDTGEKQGTISKQAARLMLAYEPNDNLHWLFNIHGAREDSDGAGRAATGVHDSRRYTDNVPTSAFIPDLNNPVLVNWHQHPEDNCNSTGTYCRTWPGKPYIKSNAGGVSVRLDYDFGNGNYTFTSLTAYEQYDGKNNSTSGAADYSDGDQLRLWTADMVTQEFRLSSAPSDRLDWLVGLYYSDDTVAEQQFSDWTSLFILDGFPPPFLFNSRVTQSTTGYAVFGHAEYQLTPKLTLIGGVRWTYEEKNMRDAGAWNLGDMTTDPSILAVYGGDPVVLAGWADNGMISGNINLVPTVPSDLDKDHKDDEPSGKVALMWEPNDNHTMFFNYSVGVKSGGYNSNNIIFPKEIEPFDRELVKATEFGWKGRTAGGKLSGTLALFQYDFLDRQTSFGVWDPVYTGATGVVNVDKTDTRGGELEVNFRPTDHFSWSAGAAYVRAVTKVFFAFDRRASRDLGRVCDERGQNPGSGSSWCNIERDYSGDRLNFRPWQISSRMAYDWDVADKNLRLSVHWAYQSSPPDIQGDGDVPPPTRILGANLSLNAPESNWSADLWVRNLTNVQPITEGGGGDFLEGRRPQMPRTWGLRFSRSWD